MRISARRIQYHRRIPTFVSLSSSSLRSISPVASVMRSMSASRSAPPPARTSDGFSVDSSSSSLSSLSACRLSRFLRSL